MCRHRFELQPSEFANALACLRGGVGRHSKNYIESTEDQCIDTHGAVPIVKVSTAIGVIGLTPYIVVNWLYQALVDVYNAFENALGVFRFGSDDSQAIGGGSGESMLGWGTHLGAVRDQAMIAWDYDVDFVCFCKPHVDVNKLLHGVCVALRPLGYNLTQW